MGFDDNKVKFFQFKSVNTGKAITNNKYGTYFPKIPTTTKTLSGNAGGGVDQCTNSMYSQSKK